MGNVFSWFFKKAGVEEQLEELKVQIDDKKERLQGYKASHSAAHSAILRLFLLAQLAAAGWFWLIRRPTNLLTEKARDVTLLVLWPLLLWLLRRVVDWFYGRRIRNDERLLADLYKQQVAKLRSIEEDPEFKKKLEMLKKFGKGVQGYDVPLSLPEQPQQHQQQQVSRPAAPRVVQQPTPQHSRPVSAPPPAAASPAVPPPAASSARAPSPPSTPKMYTQPVERPRSSVPRAVAEPRLTLTPTKGGLFQSLVDLVVGEGLPELSVALTCSKCGANNGLVKKEDFPDLFVCKVCNYENVGGRAAVANGGTPVKTAVSERSGNENAANNNNNNNDNDDDGDDDGNKGDGDASSSVAANTKRR